MDENYLLTTPLARRLYHECAEALPIVDYHNHLSIADILTDRKYDDIAELWLLPDPYKHRAMRICGVPEEYITGKRSNREKFTAWCEVFPRLVGNPLYDWSILELERVFGISLRPCRENADRLWAECNAKLGTDSFSARGLLRQFGVEYAAPCMSMTEDPAALAALPFLAPSLRGDDLVRPTLSTLSALEEKSGVKITDLDSFSCAADILLGRFAAAGCRFADHALDNGFVYTPTDDDPLRAMLAGERIDSATLASSLLFTLAGLYAKHGMTLQLHIGAERFTSSRLRAAVGPAGGFAGIGNSADVKSLIALIDGLDVAGKLPKIILFPLNPADNAMLSVLSGSFSGDGVEAIVSEGPAWWWCDHMSGIKDMLEKTSAFGVLSTFVGMTTDSRSLLSFVRHEYFRRILCMWIGEKAQRGELPDSFDIYEELVKKICYGNAAALIQK